MNGLGGEAEELTTRAFALPDKDMVPAEPVLEPPKPPKSAYSFFAADNDVLSTNLAAPKWRRLLHRRASGASAPVPSARKLAAGRDAG